MPSAVSILSLIRSGIPWRGPRSAPAFRSRSSASAAARAPGFVSITARSAGPRRSSRSTRSKYCSTSPRAVKRPESSPAWSSAMPSSPISAKGMSRGRDGRAAIAAAAALPLRPACRNRLRLHRPVSLKIVFSSVMGMPPGFGSRKDHPCGRPFLGVDLKKKAATSGLRPLANSNPISLSPEWRLCRPWPRGISRPAWPGS